MQTKYSKPASDDEQPTSLTEYLGFSFFVVWMLMAVPQTLAILAGLKALVGVKMLIVGLPIAIFLAVFPIVGPVLGLLGAVKGWGWSWTGAALLFLTPWFLAWLGSVCLGIADIKRRKRENP